MNHWFNYDEYAPEPPSQVDINLVKQIIGELRYMRELISHNNACSCFTYGIEGGVCALNSRVGGILETAAMLLDKHLASNVDESQGYKFDATIDTPLTVPPKELT